MDDVVAQPIQGVQNCIVKFLHSAHRMALGTTKHDVALAATPGQPVIQEFVVQQMTQGLRAAQDRLIA
eukprot:1671413-Prorocentrum_lima.AAC.1